MDRLWLPVTKDWRLNERHYGALTGLNKKETAEKHGADQVKIWRRSFDVPPPPLDPSSPYHPARDPRYAGLPPGALPAGALGFVGADKGLYLAQSNGGQFVSTLALGPSASVRDQFAVASGVPVTGTVEWLDGNDTGALVRWRSCAHWASSVVLP